MICEPFRNTDATTRRILCLVQEALENPGIFVVASDHLNRAIAHRYVAKKASEILSLLNVPHIVVGYTVRVEPFGENND